MANLDEVSLDELQAAITRRRQPAPLFEKDGKKYYDPGSYAKLLEYFDEVGAPVNYTPLEFNPDGTAKTAEPQYVAINLQAYVSNLARLMDDGQIRIVFDTRTVNEAKTADVTLAQIPQYVLTPDRNEALGYKVSQSVVSRDEFLTEYTDSLNLPDSLKVLEAIENLDFGTGTISLGSKHKTVSKPRRKANEVVDLTEKA